jgi:hypothetical protein
MMYQSCCIGLISAKIYCELRASTKAGIGHEVNGVVWSALVAIIESAAFYLAAIAAYLVLTSIHSFGKYLILYSVSIVDTSIIS